VKQLELELGSFGMPAAPLQLTPELQERLVALMADALQAVVADVPEQQEEEERTHDHE
jgi:hypothetical protein